MDTGPLRRNGMKDFVLGFIHFLFLFHFVLFISLILLHIEVFYFFNGSHHGSGWGFWIMISDECLWDIGGDFAVSSQNGEMGERLVLLEQPVPCTRTEFVRN